MLVEVITYALQHGIRQSLLVAFVTQLDHKMTMQRDIERRIQSYNFV